MKSKTMKKGMFCNMYLVPFTFVKKEEIKFPKDYQKKFKPFKNASEVLIAYAETMILMQQWNKAYKSAKTKPVDAKKILMLKKMLQETCFITPHQSIMFYSTSMNDQFNYIYYLILKSYQKMNKVNHH